MGEADDSESEDLSFLDEKEQEYNPLDDGEAIDVIAMVDEVIENDTLVAPDLRLDDSSCPEAPNVFDWMISDKFLGCEPPYLEQALICIQLFAEYCVAKGSYIYTDKGLQTIEDALGNPDKKGMYECSFSTVGLSGIKEATYGGMTSKRRKCLKVSYANGKSVIVTPEHKILKLNKNYSFSWVEARHLDVGDVGVSKLGQNLFPVNAYRLVFEDVEPSRLYTHTSGQVVDNNNSGKDFSIPELMTNELARLIGYLISDGSVARQGNSIDFTSLTDSGLADDFVYCIKSVFGLDCKVTTDNWKHNSTRPYSYVQVHSRKLVRFFNSLGVSGLCYDKTIPKCILESTREHVIECLRAIMDCDGWTDYKVGIVLSSQKAVKQMQLLFDNLGLYGKYREYVDTGSAVSHREHDDPKNLRAEWVLRSCPTQFASIIGTRNNLRKDKLFSKTAKDTSFSVSGNGNYKPGVVPFGRELYAYSSTLRDSYHDKGLSYIKYGRRDSFIVSNTLSDPDFVDFWNRKDNRILSRLEKLNSSNLSFSRIVSIEDAGIHEVYDITVPDGENFQCDGMIVHNCPRCSDTEWMHIDNHEPQEGLGAIVEKVQMLKFGKCPKCKAGRAEMIRSGELNFYNELAVLAGQRSGKSIVTAMASTYITHRILKMQKPTEIFRVGKGQILHATFVALTQGQAKETLWDPFLGYINNSPWFKKYHALMKFYERKYHTEFVRVKDMFIHYKHRNLILYPAGPDKRKLRGRTRVIGAIDEIGWFDNNKASNKITIDANGVYEALVRSLGTLRASEDRLVDIGYDQALTAYMLNISSPSSIRDKICELVRTSIGSRKTFGLHAPTWKMNPTISRNSGFIVEEYRKDPITAQRDYGADPPLSANAFINNKLLVEEAFSKTNRNFIKYKQDFIVVGKEKYRYGVVDKVKPGSSYSIMALDAGYTNNSFSMVVGSFNSQGIPTIEVVCEIIPRPGIPLHYTMIYEEVMKPIIEARNVRIVLADRWNSLKLLHDIQLDFQDVDMIIKQYSLKYQDFWAVKTGLEQFQLIIPAMNKGSELDKLLRDPLDEYPYCFDGRPIEHLALQILTVQDSGRTVLKGEGDLTDDSFRALSLFYWGIRDPEYSEIILQPMKESEKPKLPIGIALLGSKTNSSGVSSQAKHYSSGNGGNIGLTQRRK